MSFINRYLKAERVLHGLTQAQLAERLGRSQTWLSELERGQLQPNDVDVALICRVLGRSPQDLFPHEKVAHA